MPTKGGDVGGDVVTHTSEGITSKGSVRTLLVVWPGAPNVASLLTLGPKVTLKWYVHACPQCGLALLDHVVDPGRLGQVQLSHTLLPGLRSQSQDHKNLCNLAQSTGEPSVCRAGKKFKYKNC